MSTPTEPYYSLALYEQGQWFIAFGDWDEHSVIQEFQDEYADNHNLCAIIRTDGTQEHIDNAIADLNAGEHSATHEGTATIH